MKLPEEMLDSTLTEAAQKIHAANVAKGFYTSDPRNILEILCLLHSEVSEIAEAYRSGKGCEPNVMEHFAKSEDFKTFYNEHVKGTVEEEFADVFIRLLDAAGYMKIDLETHVLMKLKYNELRPYKHGKKF